MPNLFQLVSSVLIWYRKYFSHWLGLTNQIWLQNNVKTYILIELNHDPPCARHYMYHQDILIEYTELVWYPNGSNVENGWYIMSTDCDRHLPFPSASTGVQGYFCAYANQKTSIVLVGNIDTNCGLYPFEVHQCLDIISLCRSRWWSE